MANALFNKAREAFITGAVNMLADNIKVLLVDTTSINAYTFNAAHQFLSDIPALARVATSGNLATKTALNGIFDAADVEFVALTGANVSALVLYKDTGVEGSSPLVLWIDEGNFPIVPNGGDVLFRWSDDANRIFRI